MNKLLQGKLDIKFLNGTEETIVITPNQTGVFNEETHTIYLYARGAGEKSVPQKIICNFIIVYIHG